MIHELLLFLTGIVVFEAVTNTCNVEAQQTCDTIYTIAGMEPILPFRLQVPSIVATYQVGHPSSLTNLFEVLYINGNVTTPKIFNWFEYGPDVDLAAGKLDLKLLQVTSNRTGQYVLKNVGTKLPVQCIDVVLLGTPTKPEITASAVPYVSENLVLTCSSSHTTVPADGLTMEYTWIVDTVTNPSDVRYVYTSNRGTLTINSVVKADAQKQINCTAREVVSGGLTSTPSDVYPVIVLYGPGDVALNPSQLAHTVAEGSPFPSITCSADCYPGCSYVWNKNGSPIASSSGTLSLGTADRTDSGNYRCTATNSNRTEHTSNSSVIVVTVKYGPENIRFLPQPNVVEINESQPMLKQCLADCVPACSYVWMKGSTSISTSQNLTFQSVPSNNAGVYTCTASNTDMQTPNLSKTFTLNVIYGPRSIQLTPTTTSYREDIGTNLPSIRCGASCWPCTYTWTGPGSFTPSGAELNLPALNKGHHGDYACTVKNSRTLNSATATVTVEVKFGPENIAISPPATFYTQNEETLLDPITCSSSCFPKCSFSWKKGGSTFSSTSVLSMGTLDSTKSENYSCWAANPERAASEKMGPVVDLRVRYGPSTSVLDSESPYIATEGDMMKTISCSSNCWPSCTNNWNTGSQSTLSLGVANRSLTGNYTCTSSNTAQQYNKVSMSTLEILVKYTDKPEVNISGETLMGGSTDVICKAKGYPTTFNYTSFVHTLNGITIRNNSTSIGSRDIATFSISSLKLEDTGTYTCSVNNGVNDREGVLTQTSSVQMLVKGKPAISHLNKKVVAGETTKAVTIVVMYYSYPQMKNKPVILNNSAPLPTTDKITSLVEPSNVTFLFYETQVKLAGKAVSLTITNLQEEDFGNYTFILDNGVAGSPTKYTVELKPDSKPLQPTDFRHNGSFGVPIFTWKKGFNGGHVQTFIIQTSPVGMENWTNKTTVHEDDDQYIIGHNIYRANVTGLGAGTYRARITAFNSIGQCKPLLLNDSFTIIQPQETDESSSGIPSALIGGVAGGTVGLVVIPLVILFVIYKRKHVSKGEANGLMKSRNNRPINQADSDEDEEVENVMYQSAGDVPKPSGSAADNVYAKPLKNKPSATTGDIYAVVDKKKKGKPKPKQKLKKGVSGNDVYENAPVKAVKSEKVYANPAFDENPYENPEKSQQPKRNVNKDGLLYADLEFANQSKGQRKLVIHGLDDMTEYADVDLTKKADPLPDSDGEEK